MLYLQLNTVTIELRLWDDKSKNPKVITAIKKLEKSICTIMGNQNLGVWANHTIVEGKYIIHFQTPDPDLFVSKIIGQIHKYGPRKGSRIVKEFESILVEEETIDF